MVGYPERRQVAFVSHMKENTEILFYSCDWCHSLLKTVSGGRLRRGPAPLHNRRFSTLVCCAKIESITDILCHCTSPAGTKEHLSPRPPDPEGHGETPLRPVPAAAAVPGEFTAHVIASAARQSSPGPPAWYGDTFGGTVPWPPAFPSVAPRRNTPDLDGRTKDKSISHPPPIRGTPPKAYRSA
jgi:hypothetical protein